MKYQALTGGIAMALACGTALAAVSEDEAAKLSNDAETELTAIGATQAGNEEGTIPAWTGGLIKNGGVPDNYVEGGPYVDPFPDDKPQFVIKNNNLRDYEDKLTEGHKALLKTYVSYEMPVYETRRTAWYPEEIYDSTIANATTAVLEGTEALKDATLGFPFPIPHADNAAAQVLWNHKVRYRADTVIRANDQVYMRPDGNYTLSQRIEKVLFTYGNISEPGNIGSDNLLFYYLAEVLAPAKSAGEFTLVHETADQIKQTRKAWIANKGAPRPRRAPNVSYDNPSVGTDGQQFNEQVDMYNGAFDYFDWELEGKREVYIPYNAYRISNPENYKYDDLITPKHFNQQATRYELHRVWVVKGTLKAGIRHSFGSRRFYVDEDSWGIVAAENYDTRGELWKFQEGHTINFYTFGVNSTTPEISYDLINNSYFVSALTNEGKPNQANQELDPQDFTPSSLKRLLR